MANVLLLVLLIVSIILTGLILIQRSEGGALGIGGGGGGGGGGFMSGRSATNSVVRMTGILGAAFLVCSLLLSIAFDRENQNTSILDQTAEDSPLTIEVDSGDETDPLGSLLPGGSTDETGSDTTDADSTETPDNQTDTENTENETPEE